MRRLKSPSVRKRRSLRLIRVFRSVLDPTKGRLVAGGVSLPCALGRSGPVRRKREGDGGTPVARLKALGLVFRPDKGPRPATLLPARPIRQSDGWCDDLRSPAYNRPVTLPSRFGHERMWRDDALYDIVIDLAWNRGPILKGRGSAIFLHAARPGFLPTEGCVAIARDKLPVLARLIGPQTVLCVCTPEGVRASRMS